MTRLHVVKTAQIKNSFVRAYSHWEMGVLESEAGAQSLSSPEVPEKPAYFHLSLYKEDAPRVFRIKPYPKPSPSWAVSTQGRFLNSSVCQFLAQKADGLYLEAYDSPVLKVSLGLLITGYMRKEKQTEP